MENTIIVNRSLNSQLFQFFLGKGAKIDLTQATRPMIHFLRQEYLNDQECISGDIEKLFEIDAVYRFDTE